jgi:hypothetical protein
MLRIDHGWLRHVASLLNGRRRAGGYRSDLQDRSCARSNRTRTPGSYRRTKDRGYSSRTPLNRRTRHSRRSCSSHPRRSSNRAIRCSRSSVDDETARAVLQHAYVARVARHRACVANLGCRVRSRVRGMRGPVVARAAHHGDACRNSECARQSGAPSHRCFDRFALIIHPQRASRARARGPDPAFVVLSSVILRSSALSARTHRLRTAWIDAAPWVERVGKGLRVVVGAEQSG